MKLFVTERREKILELLNEKRRLTVKELSKQIGVSQATLRTDLNELESENLLVRTHGGAMLNEDLEDTSFYFRAKQNKGEKERIANTAIDLLQDKQTILLDASSTVMELATLIKSSNLRITVLTSSIQTAAVLKDNPSITVVIIGGVVTSGSTSVEGKLGLDILNHFNIDLLFTSGSGFTSDKGLTDFNLYEVELKTEMVKQAKKVIALVDHTKIGQNSSSVFAKSSEIDTLITDSPVSKDISTQLNKEKIQLLIPDN